MDPNATLQMIAQYLKDDGDGEGAREYAGYLREWIDNGGFAPDWSKHPLAYVYYLHRVYMRNNGMQLDDRVWNAESAIAEIILHYYGR